VPEGTSVRLFPLEVFPDKPGDETLAIVDQAGVGVTLREGGTGLSSTLLTSLPAGVDQLAGEVGVGQLDEGVPCPQLVFPYKDATSVAVFTPCRLEKDGATGWNTDGEMRTIALPQGKRIDRGVIVADLDLDKHLDLLIGASGGAYVAWGSGDGSFRSAQQGGATNEAGTYTLPKAVGQEETFPLAVADLNADGRIDYVFPSGVVTSNAGGYAESYDNLGSAWTSAVIADFNANALPDVVAGSSEAINLDFLNNAGGALNHASLPTDGPVAHISLGDFDGDLINDVVYAEVFSDGETAQDRVRVAFGAAYGAPGGAIDLGVLGDVQQLVPTHLRTASGADAIAELKVVAQQQQAQSKIVKTDFISTFYGNAARVMFAPLPLRYMDTPALPVALARGRFGDDTPDMAALGMVGKLHELRMWRVEGAEQIQPNDLQPSAVLSDKFTPAKAHDFNFRYGAVMATGDLDGDGNDEVVVAAPYDGGAAGDAAIVIAHYNAGQRIFEPGTEVPLFATLSEHASLLLRDLDGDRRLDAILCAGSPDEPGDVLILWGNDQKGFDIDEPTRLHPSLGARSIACLPAATTNGCDLIVASDEGVHRVTVRPDRSTEVSLIVYAPSARAVGAADFDADGVADVALQDSDELRVYRSVPVVQ
jgi:hypothetical protein